jgi:hypothetical protein
MRGYSSVICPEGSCGFWLSDTQLKQGLKIYLGKVVDDPHGYQVP